MSDKHQLTDKKGEFSDNYYLKEEESGKRLLEERDLDTPQMFDMWFKDIKPDQDFKDEIISIVKGWQDLIPEEADKKDVHLHILGQSHIDMAWKWRYRQTRRKGIKTMRKAIRHTEMFPDSFLYAASQPCLLDWIKEDEPELFEKIKEYHKKGNIELVGGSWVEPDCMMPSGEAFVRQRLYGMMFYKKEFGTLPEVEWYLDSFGYNVGLPQILSKSGTKYLWTNKMTWNMQTTFPFVYYNWRSPDGSEILTSAFEQHKSVFQKWDQYLPGRFQLKENGKRVWSYEDDYSKLTEHIDRDQFVPHIGFFEGKGDGGHGPTHQEVAEMDEYVNADDEVAMNIHWSKAQSFFKDVAQCRSNLPVWNDEMYLEYHRGCFSVHSETKRHNRGLENLLLTTEKIASLTSILDSEYDYPFEKIRDVWKDVLLNQFHDVLPGSSCPEVYDDTYIIWQRSYGILNGIISDCITRFGNGSNSESSAKHVISIYNPLPWERKERVFIPLTEIEGDITLDEDGKPPYATLELEDDLSLETITCQPVAADFKDNMMNRSAGWWCVLLVPPLGVIKAKLKLSECVESPLFIKKQKNALMNNGTIGVSVSLENGAIEEIKAGYLNNGNNLVQGKENFLIEGYHDKAKSYPAWNIQEEYWKYPKNYPQSKDLSISVEDEGPVFITLAIEKTLHSPNEENSPKSKVVQKVRLFKDDPRIYCLWASDWNEKDTMLKIGMNTNTQAENVTVDEQYCALDMSTLPETPADKARYEKIMHKYADISTPDRTWGMALLNEGKYAFDASAGLLRLTLHRAPEYPNPPGESWLNIEREVNKEENGNEVPSHSGLGPISCRFAYLFHEGGSLLDAEGKPNNAVKKAAEEFNNPMVVKSLSGQDSSKKDMNNSISFPDINLYLPDNVELTAIKRKEWDDSNSLILRFVETCGLEGTNANVLLPEFLGEKIKNIVPVDLLERKIDEKLEWNKEDYQLNFDIGKFEIKSFELSLF